MGGWYYVKMNSFWKKYQRKEPLLVVELKYNMNINIIYASYII